MAWPKPAQSAIGSATRRLVAAILWSLVSYVPCHGEPLPRIALLIGNQHYNSRVGAPLEYPSQDIANLEASLRRFGFRVKTFRDLDYKTMDVEIKTYARDLHDAGQGAIGFFYYSGHGASDPAMRFNYLIPVDVQSADDRRLWDNSIRQDEIIARLGREASNASHILVFDACRNELDLPQTAGKSLSGTKGFEGVQAVSGMLIAYATAPNRSAADTGQFSTILAEELLREGMEVVSIFRNVQFRAKAYMNQEPFLSIGGLGKTYLKAAPEGPCNAVELGSAGQRTCRLPGDAQAFRDCDACPEMVLVPSGQVVFYDELSAFGSLRQLFSRADLRTAHPVRFAEPLPVSRSPITFDDWDACVSAGGCANYKPPDEGWGRHERPVINVSWNDARNYVRWLSDRTGHTYRLLSEAERKYLSANDQGGPKDCNCDKIEVTYTPTMIYNQNGQGTYAHKQTITATKRSSTVKVDEYKPNDWGIYQVAGNVDEWLEDCWHDTWTGMPADGAPRTSSGGECEERTVVGLVARDPWFFGPYLEYRWSAKRATRDRLTGFRVVRSVSP